MGRFDKYLSAPPEEREAVVRHGGDRFVFRGKSSGSVIQKALLTAEQTVSRAAHYRAVSGALVEPSDVPTIVLMATFFVQEEGDSMDEARFALLKENDFALYGKFARAVNEIGGFGETDTDDDGGPETAVDASVRAGLGNSRAGAPDGSRSSSSASKRPGTTTPIS